MEMKEKLVLFWEVEKKVNWLKVPGFFQLNL